MRLKNHPGDASPMTSLQSGDCEQFPQSVFLEGVYAWNRKTLSVFCANSAHAHNDITIETIRFCCMLFT
jgi:hypothetical protein